MKEKEKGIRNNKSRIGWDEAKETESEDIKTNFCVKLQFIFVLYS